MGKERRGIVGPSQDEVQEANQPQELGRPNILKRAAGTVGWRIVAIGSMFGTVAVAEACTTKPPAIVRPEKTPQATSNPVKTPEAVATPTPETINLPAVNLTNEFLTKGLTGIGAGEEIDSSLETKGTLGGYFSEVQAMWRQGAAKFEDIAKNPVLALKFLVGFGQSGGFENSTYALEKTFPQLKDLRFFRSTLEKMPESAKETVLTVALPGELKLRAGTHLTIIGTYQEKEMNWVLASFDEGFDRSYEGVVAREVPRQFFALLSQETVTKLLGENKVSFSKGQIVFKDEGKTYRWTANAIVKDLFEAFKKEAGIFFADQKPDGKWYFNPIVSYPPKELVGENYQVKRTEEGKIVAQDGAGKEIAQASYNDKEHEWEWKGPTQYLKEGDRYVYRTEKGELINIPAIAGLRQELQGDKVVYLASGEYMGEFVPNVNVEAKQTGGVVLKAPIALRLINEKLATIPEQKDKWIIPLPIDPREMNPTRGISLSFEKGYGPYQIPVLKLTFDENLPLVNIIPEAQQLFILKGVYYEWGYGDNMTLIDPYTDRIFPGMEMRYLTVTGKFQGFSRNTAMNIGFADKVSTIEDSVYVALTAAWEWYSVTSDKILTAGQTPVFVAVNP